MVALTQGNKKWRRRAEARPGELIAAALRCFAERGFAATRLEDIASEAGISKATVYLYFENKDRLFEAVVRSAITPVLDQAQALVAAYEGTTFDLVRTVLGGMAAALEGRFPAIVKLVIAESGNFPELARLWADVVLRRSFALVRSIVERGITRGELRDVDPVTVTPLFVAPIVVLSIWKEAFAQHTDLTLDLRAVLALHAEVFLHGLGASGPTATPTRATPARPTPTRPRRRRTR